ncbi:glycosyltransferase, partial [Candidatus Dependentiae bacterium]|nr:glycosyltransferase [Candidatus Dependentiae bacterium]
SPILEKIIQKILAKDNIDILWANEIFLAQYFPINFNGLKVLDRQKIDSIYIRDVLKELYPGKIKRSLKKFDLKNLNDYERSIIDKCDICFLPSDQDIANLTPEEKKKYKVLPNSINLNEYTFIPYKKRQELNRLSIFANWEYPPNVQGLKWFLKEIRDLTLPDHLILNVEGKGSEELRLKVKSGINIRGYAKEITQIYNNARAMIVPLNTGGGTRLKIMEALASGVPVLSTKVGAEGLGIVPGEHYLMFNSGKQFLEKVKILKNKPESIDKMVQAAYKLVKENFSGKSIEKFLTDSFKKR